MSPPVFLVEPGTLVAAGGPVLLDGEEGRHAARVRRLGPGEAVELVDGAGVRGRGAVAEVVGRDVLRVRLDAVVVEPAPRPRLVVVQALPKGDRGELAVELLTEVGVDEVVPWAARRCVAVWRAGRADNGLRRWRAAAREAAKQSRRARLPVVADLAGTEEVAGRLASAGAALVLHEGAPQPLAGILAGGGAPDGDVVLVVGPEGGVAPDELERFARAGACAVRLGPTVLRTSTAGAVAAALVSAARGRWG